MTSTKKDPRMRFAAVTPPQQLAAAKLASKFAEHSATLPSILEPIDQLTELIAVEFTRIRQTRLPPTATDLEELSWEKAIAAELRVLKHRSPDMTASSAVKVAVHLHGMPMAVDHVPIVTVASELFPQLTWAHLLKIIPSSFKLRPELPPHYPVFDCPVLVGELEWNRRGAERRKHDSDEYRRLTDLAVRNHTFVLRYLTIAAEDNLTPRQLGLRLRKDAVPGP